MAREQHLLSTEIVNRGIELSGPDAGALTFSVRVRRRLPDFVQSVKLKYVKLGYYYVINNWLCLAATLPLLTVVFGVEVGSTIIRCEKVWGKIWENSGRLDFGVVISLLALLSFTFFLYFMSKPMPIYLVDFACCKPSDDLKVNRSLILVLAVFIYSKKFIILISIDTFCIIMCSKFIYPCKRYSDPNTIEFLLFVDSVEHFYGTSQFYFITLCGR